MLEPKAGNTDAVSPVSFQKDVGMDAARALEGRITAILNTGSGSVDATTESNVRAILDAQGLQRTKVESVSPTEIEDALSTASKSADILIVLGGDGTINAAANYCADDGPFLIPLPGGTMNMLPKALYGGQTWQAALEATLIHPKVREVSGGDVDGRRFYCAAILGSPTLWADAREAFRQGHWLEAASRAATAARRHRSDAIDYVFDDLSGAAEAVAVICPLISRDCEGDEASLEAAAIDPATASDLFGLAFHAAFDGWRNDPSVVRSKVDSISAKAHGRIPMLLDGEKVRAGRAVEILIVPVAFRALVPNSI